MTPCSLVGDHCHRLLSEYSALLKSGLHLLLSQVTISLPNQTSCRKHVAPLLPHYRTHETRVGRLHTPHLYSNTAGVLGQKPVQLSSYWRLEGSKTHWTCSAIDSTPILRRCQSYCGHILLCSCCNGNKIIPGSRVEVQMRLLRLVGLHEQRRARGRNTEQHNTENMDINSCLAGFKPTAPVFDWSGPMHWTARFCTLP